MPSLKFLDIHDYRWLNKCKVHLPKGISALPDELRYLYWDGYPLESLPANFNPENLIELRLPNSKIVELFCDEMQDMVKLRLIDLSGCGQLRKITNLSLARNVTQLNLHGCDNLCEVSSSICHLSSVIWIVLSNCPKLRSLPDLSDLKSLKRLFLDACSSLETFPKVSRSTGFLYLRGTAIKEVPSASVEHLNNLSVLPMGNCSQLESLPSNVDLKSLQVLDFSHCSALKKFPEISKNLRELYLNRTAITEVPSSVVCLSELRFLSLTGCTDLRVLPSTIWKLHFLEELRLDGCSNLTEFPQTIEEEQQEENSLYRLLRLNLSDCSLLKLPTNLGRLYSLKELRLRGNSFKTIPAGIKQLSQLETLDIADCKSLQSLPELPPNLLWIKASCCMSLETVSAALTRLDFESTNVSRQRMFNFADCLKLDEKGCGDMVRRLTNLITNGQRYKEFGATPSVSIIYMGSRIPGWIKHQSVGDSISFQFPSNWLNDRLWGFALGIVFKPCGVAGCLCHDFHCVCHIGDNYFSHTLSSYAPFDRRTEREHVLMKCDHELHDAILRNARKSQSCHDVVLLKFHISERSVKSQRCCKIKMCGVIPLYAQGGGYNTLQLLPLGGPAQEAPENERRREDKPLLMSQLDAEELGRNHVSREMDEGPPSPKRLKLTQHITGSTLAEWESTPSL